jgi:cytochrome c oxidase subunit 1
VLSLIGMASGAAASASSPGSPGRYVRFAPNNPWQGHTLEWATVSPPPTGNFSEPIPLVCSASPLLDPVPEADNGGAV